MSTAKSIVVGVSGSANSVAALRWAVTEARLHSAEVWAVHAWSSPMETLAPYAPRRGVPSHEARRGESGALLTAAITRVGDFEGSEGSSGGSSGVSVRPILVEGHPIPVLLQYAAGAHLLVLGRELRATDVADGALGAVVRTCIAYARCPTVIIGTADTTQPPQPGVLRASKGDSSSPSGDAWSLACQYDTHAALP